MITQNQPPGSNIIPFPVNAKLAQARRAYQAELERFAQAMSEGRHPRFNARIKSAYYAAHFEAQRNGRFA